MQKGIILSLIIILSSVIKSQELIKASISQKDIKSGIISCYIIIYIEGGEHLDLYSNTTFKYALLFINGKKISTSKWQMKNDKLTLNSGLDTVNLPVKIIFDRGMDLVKSKQ